VDLTNLWRAASQRPSASPFATQYLLTDYNSGWPNGWPPMVSGLSFPACNNVTLPSTGAVPKEIHPGLQALVVYADATSLTLQYTLHDGPQPPPAGSEGTGYTVYIDNIDVNPNIILDYNLADINDRRQLPALAPNAVVGRARSGEIRVAIRDTGTAMDPRSSTDWWWSFFNGYNLAEGKQATQSSILEGGYASRAVDGNTDGNWARGSVTHTQFESAPWWQVDLAEVQTVQRIEVYNRADCCAERLSNFYVFVSDVPFTSTDPSATRGQPGVWSTFVQGTGGRPTTIPVHRTGRFVRVQLANPNYLSLAEVKVIGPSPAPMATQSSTLEGGNASRAIDGNTDGNWANGSVTHTQAESNAWWQWDRGSIQNIPRMVIWNRTDCCASRLSNFYVFVSDVPFHSTDLNTTRSQPGVFSYYVGGSAGSRTEIPVNRTGRFIRIQLANTDYLSLAEVEVR
jgi:hypothetical protein